ncbi:MAG: protein phosphatase 2C domain-containing protein, partial [Roseiflexaceae bacterium]|nr:protein phosphatase 2C domain-containing protein [Roseiflexaceae bacterium]
RIEVIDREPWRRCWACGTTSNESGELFCTECGASLDDRHYHGVLVNGEPQGLALVPEVSDPAARALLPEIWDEVPDGESQLVLMLAGRGEPLAPPLGDLEALHVGQNLAILLAALHSEGFTLGEISPDSVEMTAAAKPRLRAVPDLRRGGDPAADLRELAKLLETLTATERTTQRLSEEQIDATAVEPGLPDVLRDLRTGVLADATALSSRLAELIADKASPRSLWVWVGARSDTGRVRDHNEDSLLSLDLRLDQNNEGRCWGLYIVADGMGGHSAGEVASGLAIRGAAESVLRTYMAPTLESDLPFDEDMLKEVVFNAITQANAYVLREAQARGNDMGTTMTMAVVVGDRAVIGNVGDSRTYLYREDTLRRVSKDNSLVQRLVDLGQIGPDDVYTHPQRNAVLRSLGDRAEVGIDLYVERLRPGDVLLLSSDGLWEMVRDQQIASLLAEHEHPQAAADALTTTANTNGGEDNISALVLRFGSYK